MLSVDDASVVARDSKLPGLVVLLDNELACRLFQKYLSDLSPQSARCTYLRYKPGVSCLASFELGTSEGKHTVHATAYRVDATDKLAKFSQAAQLGEVRCLEPFVVPELAIVVSPFPCDSELPALERMLSLDGRQQLLSRLLHESDNDLLSAQWRELRYKPERRFVARLDVDEEPRAVLKLHSEKSYAQSRRSAKSLGSHVGINTARVLGHSDRYHAILLEWLAGKTLLGLLNAPTQAKVAMESVGRLLAQLHALPICKLPKRTTGRETQELHRLAEDIAVVSPALGELMKEVALRCSAEMAQFPAIEVPIHGDFHPQQIIIDSSGKRTNVALIDLDNAAIGHPASDIGNFIAHLEREALLGRVSRTLCEQITEALVSAYSKQHQSLSRRSIQVCLAAGLLRITHEPFRYRHTNWHDETKQLVEHAINILDNPVDTRSTSRPRTSDVVVVDPFRVAEDVALSTAAKALNPSFVSDSIAPIIRQVFQDDSLEIQSIRVLKYKPGRRCLVEYSCKSTAGNKAIVLGKIHAKRRHKQSYQLQKTLWENGFDYESDDISDDGISVARPIGIIPECRMWLQEKVQGTSCWDALSGPLSKTVATRIADAAHKLHQADLVTQRVHTLDDELQVLEEKLPQVAKHAPQFRSRIDFVLRACQELAASIQSSPPTGIHRDFYPDQVLVDGDRICVLDHDLFCLGDPCLDIGNFCGHLIERSLRLHGHPDTFAECQRQLIDRFCSLRESCSPNAIDAYTTLTVARHIYLSTHIAGRRSNTSLMLDYCEHLLGYRTTRS